MLAPEHGRTPVCIDSDPEYAGRGVFGLRRTARQPGDGPAWPSDSPGPGPSDKPRVVSTKPGAVQ